MYATGEGGPLMGIGEVFEKPIAYKSSKREDKKAEGNISLNKQFMLHCFVPYRLH
jgi:hypothetical protein